MRRLYLGKIERFVIGTEDLRVLSLAIVVFQSLGIRFFEGQGWGLSLLLLGLNGSAILKVRIRDAVFLGCTLVFLLLNWAINPAFSIMSMGFQYILIVSAYLLLLKYVEEEDRLERDLYFCFKVFVIHALLGYLLYMIIPSAYSYRIGLNRSFLGLFFVSISSFAGIVRNTGLFWEPGVYQLVANLFLFFAIKFKKGLLTICLGVLAVVVSFSTLGFVVLVFNAIYFLLSRVSLKVKNVFSFFVLGVVLVFLVGPVLVANVSEKVSDTNSSSLARLRDLMIGFALIQEKPVLGHGKFETDYLIEKDYVSRIESQVFSSEYLDIHETMSGGLTNGFFSLFAWYGLPVGVFLFYSFFKQKIVRGFTFEKIVFVLIPFVSFFSEPITYTPFFFLYPLSFFVFKN